MMVQGNARKAGFSVGGMLKVCAKTIEKAPGKPFGA